MTAGQFLASGDVMPFSHAAEIVLAASSNTTQTIPVDGDADFELHKLAAFLNPSGNPWLVRLLDTGSARALSSRMIAGDTLFGTAERPFIFPVAHIFRRSGGIQLDLENLHTAQVTFYLTLHGVKRWQ